MKTKQTRSAWTVALSLGTASLLGASAVAHAETIYVSSFVSHTIDMFTSDGAGSAFATTGSSGPSGLALDSQGNLYVAIMADNTIMKFTPGGVSSVFANTGLSLPTGLAFDGAGNLYVANLGFDTAGTLYVANAANNTIMQFNPAGAGSVFASTGLNDPLGIVIQVPEPPAWETFSLAIVGLAFWHCRKPGRA